MNGSSFVPLGHVDAAAGPVCDLASMACLCSFTRLLALEQILGIISSLNPGTRYWKLCSRIEKFPGQSSRRSLKNVCVANLSRRETVKDVNRPSTWSSSRGKRFSLFYSSGCTKMKIPYESSGQKCTFLIYIIVFRSFSTFLYIRVRSTGRGSACFLPFSGLCP